MTWRTVITGGAGFLGSHLADRLLSEGMDVVAVDNLITGSMDNIAHLANEPRFEFIEQDIIKPYDVPGRVDAVYHFASPASPVDYLELPLETLLVGSMGTHNTLELARRKDARIVLASTSEVYGDPTVHPQTEEYWGNVNPNGTRSVYDEAKRYAESVTFAYKRLYGMNCKIIRIFNTYGPRMRVKDGRVVPTFITQALLGRPLTVFGTGTQTRSFCYVSDLIDGITRMSLSEQSGPINLGNPLELTMVQFAEEILKSTGSESAIEYHPLPTADDPRQRNPDITKARALLGWEPSVSLATGLAATIGDFRTRLGLAS
ncbi:MAG: UDP-glucuronic acid decarboxylase family protein [Capsulimonadaceae bacterium]